MPLEYKVTIYPPPLKGRKYYWEVSRGGHTTHGLSDDMETAERDARALVNARHADQRRQEEARAQIKEFIIPPPVTVPPPSDLPHVTPSGLPSTPAWKKIWPFKHWLR